MKNSWVKAAVSIARGESDETAAQAAGVTSRTIRAWRADEPEFAQKVNDLRRDMFEDASGQLSALSVKATEQLGDLLESDDERTRLSAVRLILQSAPVFRDSVDWESRIMELELAAGLRK